MKSMTKETLNVISVEQAGNLAGLFIERVKRTPNAIAYRYYDPKQTAWRTHTWTEASLQVIAIQNALIKEELQAGDRVAIMLNNCPQWAYFEQAALGLGLVVVPLYTNDRANNVAYVLQDAGVKLLFIDNEITLKLLEPISSQLQGLLRIITAEACAVMSLYPRLASMADWKSNDKKSPSLPKIDIDDLATLVYTSGTTGRSKGVMLSHRNILFNASSAIEIFPIYREDVMLSFLPLSHMLERTLGYYIPMMCGSTVAYARSVQDLAEDLLSQRPTILISVPRIYERVYNKIMTQLEHKSPFAKYLFKSAIELGWQRFKAGSRGGIRWPILNALVGKKVMAKLGGRLRLAICGGAPLSPEVAKTFIGLGLNLIQGYGLTETSPIISGNPTENNEPASVGIAFPGIEVKIGENDELLVRSPSNMLGYWQNPEATEAIIDTDGWLRTGDKGRIENDHIFITGRLKDIIILSNGEKVPPADLEVAISLDPLFEQVLIIGEGRPFLTAIIVLEQEAWRNISNQENFNNQDPNYLTTKPVREFVLGRIAERLKDFPGYTSVRAVTLQHEQWTIDGATMTPTMKLRRSVIIDRNLEVIEKMYEGH